MFYNSNFLHSIRYWLWLTDTKVSPQGLHNSQWRSQHNGHQQNHGSQLPPTTQVNTWHLDTNTRLMTVHLLHAGSCNWKGQGSSGTSNLQIICRYSLHTYTNSWRYAGVLCFACRLDAGSFGTMGVGLGFAVAAGIWCKDHAPGKRVISIQGDSAFGFSGMEIETICR